jgi:hypothetical protein
MCSQVHRGHPAHKVRQAQERAARVADHRPGVVHLGRHRQPHRARPQQHPRQDPRPLRLLQQRLHHLLVAQLLLHPLHHHDLPLLQHFQGIITPPTTTLMQSALFFETNAVAEGVSKREREET